MPSSFGPLPLLACLAALGLVAFPSRRAALLAGIAACGAFLLLRGPSATTQVGTWSVIACFWLAWWAIMQTQTRQIRDMLMLAELAEVDEATLCVNRRGFVARLERATAHAVQTGTPLALVALDLDHFKRVNDQFGHLAGDAVLGEIGAMLRRAVANGGVVARLGGEEFAVLLPETDEEEAGVMAERILAATRTLRLARLPGDVRLTMSAGIATEQMYGAHSSDALRARADEALYVAKRNGRDRALLWAPGVHSHATPIRSMVAIGGR